MSTDEPMQSAESATTGSDTQYQVKIIMSQQTLSALMGGNYHLYGFKAVRSTQGGGAPAVWFQINEYANETNIAWTDRSQAYVSMQPIITGERIRPISAAEIVPGQTLNVEPDRSTTVVNGGPSTAISIFNKTTSQLICGLSAFIGEEATPICAFPLYGNQMSSITPTTRILLLFSTNYLRPGTMIGPSLQALDLQGELLHAGTPGILIDLDSSNERTVSFDINTGWDWEQFSWGRQVWANEDIAPLLITP
jgi:hypothetical protein